MDYENTEFLYQHKSVVTTLKIHVEQHQVFDPMFT